MDLLHQGDILKIEKIKQYADKLVAGDIVNLSGIVYKIKNQEPILI